MIHQTKLTDILNPNKFKNCELKPWAGPIKSFFIDTFFMGHPVRFHIYSPGRLYDLRYLLCNSLDCLDIRKSVKSEVLSYGLTTARRFLEMTKMPLLPIRKLPEVSSIWQGSWCSMALGGIWKAFQVVFWCEYVCWDVFSDTWWKVWYLTEQYLNK